MAFRIGYRMSQGQQSATPTGGGFVLDQFTAAHGSFASTVLPLSKGIGIVPVFDINSLDFRGVLASTPQGDYEPVSVVPNVIVGRISLALGTSLASAASNPIWSVKRSRAGTVVTMATFDATTQNFAAAWTPVNRTGAQVSNPTLLAGDVLFVSIVSTTSGPPPIPPFIVQIDGEA